MLKCVIIIVQITHTQPQAIQNSMNIVVSSQDIDDVIEHLGSFLGVNIFTTSTSEIRYVDDE